MRIVHSLEFGRFTQAFVVASRQPLSHSEGRFTPGHLSEQISHPAFQMQAVVKDGVGLVELLHIRSNGAIKMRIDSGGHQCLDLHELAPHPGHHFRHGTSGGHDFDGKGPRELVFVRLVVGGLGAATHRQQDRAT